MPRNEIVLVQKDIQAETKIANAFDELQTRLAYLRAEMQHVKAVEHQQHMEKSKQDIAMDMANDAGLTVCEYDLTEVTGKQIYLTKRFDR